MSKKNMTTKQLIRKDRIQFYNQLSSDFFNGVMDDEDHELYDAREPSAKKRYNKDAEVARVQEQVYQKILHAKEKDIVMTEYSDMDRESYDNIRHQYFQHHTFSSLEKLENIRKKKEA